jgi:6-phosphofructokinase 1
MNAAVRAVVRVGIANGLDVFGVRNGFSGLMSGDFVSLGARDVGGIIDRGGTFLGSTRCAQMRTEAGQQNAISRMHDLEMEGLVVIGGNGSQAASIALSRRGIPVVGIASTIDNDLAGADITIGATTAIETAVEAIDRLRVTASSHRRAFLVEVMGRHCGYLALMAGIAGGAEAIVIPEAEIDPQALADELQDAQRRGKKHAIVVVAEAPPTMQRHWRAILPSTRAASVSSFGSRSSGTCSAAGHLVPTTGQLPRFWAQPRPRVSRRASMGCCSESWPARWHARRSPSPSKKSRST